MRCACDLRLETGLRCEKQMQWHQGYEKGQMPGYIRWACRNLHWMEPMILLSASLSTIVLFATGCLIRAFLIICMLKVFLTNYPPHCKLSFCKFQIPTLIRALLRIYFALFSSLKWPHNTPMASHRNKSHVDSRGRRGGMADQLGLPHPSSWKLTGRQVKLIPLIQIFPASPRGKAQIPSRIRLDPGSGQSSWCCKALVPNHNPEPCICMDSILFPGSCAHACAFDANFTFKAPAKVTYYTNPCQACLYCQFCVYFQVCVNCQTPQRARCLSLICPLFFS